MIISYLLLIVFTMPSNVPDVKIQMPAASVTECLTKAETLSGFVKDPVALTIQCQPIIDKPAHEGEHVD